VTIEERKLPFVTGEKTRKLRKINYNTVCWRVLTTEECLYIRIIVNDFNHSPSSTICSCCCYVQIRY